MKERGMIFNGEMVRAILDGRKTQTRRIMAPQPADDIERGIFPNPEAIGWKSSLRHKHGSTTAHFCPYGKPGDRIWVRETFQGPLFIAIAKTPLRLRSPNFAFTRLMECLRQSFTMQMMNCIAAGGHLSTCRAGPAAFCWKSPTCGWND